MKILYSAGNKKTQLYIDALHKAGAEAVGGIKPEIDTSCDGLLLCGGVDIHPKFYGEDIDGTKETDLERDEAEFKLLKAFFDAKKPVFGICRGIQLINVFFGGTLIQDIKTDTVHSANGEAAFHKMTAVKGSDIFKLYGERFTVNSYHHQAVSSVADGFCITARAKDGIAEAIEHKSLPIFGVQWHPERKTNDFDDGYKLFDRFIELCKQK